MSDYKRWISYIYYYEKNIKKNNIGYVRVETRGDMTKLTLHINVLSVIEPMDVYMIYRNNANGTMQGIKIGSISMEHGVGHGVYSVYTSDIMKTGIGVNDIGGIIVFHEKDRFYASEWDDKNIDIELFDEYENDTEKDEEIMTITEEKEPDIFYEEETPEIKEVLQAEELQEITEEDIEEDIEENEIQEDSEEDSTTKYFDYIEKFGNVKGLFDGGNSGTDDLKPAAENMLRTYPYMYPFEADDIEACVRIEPKDIEKLPINTWIIANNSFLLKGYYSYRHLIFFKVGKDRPRYMIGVPGINHNRENFLANMFGFKLFRPIKNTKNVKGEYGYWCIMV